MWKLLSMFKRLNLLSFVKNWLCYLSQQIQRLHMIKQVVCVTTFLAVVVVHICCEVEVLVEDAHHLEIDIHVNFVANMVIL